MEIRIDASTGPVDMAEQLLSQYDGLVLYGYGSKESCVVHSVHDGQPVTFTGTIHEIRDVYVRLLVDLLAVGLSTMVKDA